ncbi:hypothetical protein R5R35_007637 [Gryllus longicercus]|uniref:Secreted protein n=1 Tax=Gryllus longicercus TaxID=2509291 RepID=A0AAN9V3L2_9ORTH
MWFARPLLVLAVLRFSFIRRCPLHSLSAWLPSVPPGAQLRLVHHRPLALQRKGAITTDSLFSRRTRRRRLCVKLDLFRDKGARRLLRRRRSPRGPSHPDPRLFAIHPHPAPIQLVSIHTSSPPHLHHAHLPPLSSCPVPLRPISFRSSPLICTPPFTLPQRFLSSFTPSLFIQG